MKDLMLEATNPFSNKIMAEPLPNNFKLLALGYYDGMSDSRDHLDKFTSWIRLHGINETIMYRVFYSMLLKNAKLWF